MDLKFTIILALAFAMLAMPAMALSQGNPDLNIKYDLITDDLTGTGVYYNPECLNDCHLTLQFQWDGVMAQQIINRGTKNNLDWFFPVRYYNDDLELSDIRVLEYVTEQRTRTLFEYNETYEDIISVGQETYSVNIPTWTSVWNGAYQLNKNVPYYIDFVLTRTPSVHQKYADFVPELLGFSLGEYAWFNSSWRNKNGVVVNITTNRTDYPLRFNISSLTGMQADFDDLVFTDLNDNQIPHCIVEKVDSSWALVYIKGNWTVGINGSDQAFMYYNNSAATGQEDCDNTFDVYKDMEYADTAAVIADGLTFTAAAPGDPTWNVTADGKIWMNDNTTNNGGVDAQLSFDISPTLADFFVFVKGTMKSDALDVFPNVGFGPDYSLFNASGDSSNFTSAWRKNVGNFTLNYIRKNVIDFDAYTIAADNLTHTATYEQDIDAFGAWYIDGVLINSTTTDFTVGNPAWNLIRLDMNIAAPRGNFSTDTIAIGKFEYPSPVVAIGQAVSIDAIDPVVNISSPTGTNEFATVADINLSLNYTATDVNLTSCAFNIDGGANTSLASCQNITFTTGATGVFTINVFAFDEAANVGTDSTAIVVQLAPEVSGVTATLMTLIGLIFALGVMISGLVFILKGSDDPRGIAVGFTTFLVGIVLLVVITAITSGLINPTI